MLLWRNLDRASEECGWNGGMVMTMIDSIDSKNNLDDDLIITITYHTGLLE